ncbi:hypothetical protein KYK31_23070 [Hymenobacter norwichensis]|uniref:hypothetical protein n=1 Tax=Hymenobacter telluris TaxID=2816474 RepID=UPI001A8C4C3D|nr:hypothetical protein [Hymenobacter telluris]MBW3376884.1 hypothetical protein [Hymenobacter norwichensis]
MANLQNGYRGTGQLATSEGRRNVGQPAGKLPGILAFMDAVVGEQLLLGQKERVAEKDG